MIKKTMNRYYLTLTLIACLLTAPQQLAADALYKWTDEQGMIHFGSHPPTADDAETLEVSPVNAISSENSDSQNENNESEPLLKDELRQAREEKDALCQQARQARIDLESRHRIRVKQEDGSYQAISHEEKQDRIREAEDAIKEYCG